MLAGYVTRTAHTGCLIGTGPVQPTAVTKLAGAYQDAHNSGAAARGILCRQRVRAGPHGSGARPQRDGQRRGTARPCHEPVRSGPWCIQPACVGVPASTDAVQSHITHTSATVSGKTHACMSQAGTGMHMIILKSCTVSTTDKVTSLLLVTRSGAKTPWCFYIDAPRQVDPDAGRQENSDALTPALCRRLGAARDL